MKTYVINLFGSPGAGKSTLAAELFTELKKKNYQCEMTLEFAKELIYNEDERLVKNQLIVLGEQFRRLYVLDGKVEFLITDSPVLLSIVYNRLNNSYSKAFEEVVYESHLKTNRINFFIEKGDSFKFDSADKGRQHSENESQKISNEIKSVLKERNVKYMSFVNDGFTVAKMLDIIEKIKNAK